jgi:hypothetical protein
LAVLTFLALALFAALVWADTRTGVLAGVGIVVESDQSRTTVITFPRGPFGGSIYTETLTAAAPEARRVMVIGP